MPRQTTLLFVVIAALFFVSERELAFCGVCCERDVLSKNGLDFLDFRVSIFLQYTKSSATLLSVRVTVFGIIVRVVVVFVKNDVGARFGGFEDGDSSSLEEVVLVRDDDGVDDRRLKKIAAAAATTGDGFRAAKLYVRATVRADV